MLPPPPSHIIGGPSPCPPPPPGRTLLINQTSDLLLINKIRISLPIPAVRILCVCINNMNSENVDTESSLQMYKLPSVLFCGGGGGGQSTLFFGGGGGGGGRVHSAQGTTVCRP